MKIKLLAMIWISFVATFSANAAREGEGGVSACAEYIDIAGDIGVTLYKLGQEEVSRVNPIVKIEEVREISMNLRCLPASEDADRSITSFPDKMLSLLKVSDWEKLEMPEKVRLVTHELAVLALYERDSQYSISKDIARLIAKVPHSIGDKLKANAVYQNPNGSVTFYMPYIWMKITYNESRYTANVGRYSVIRTEYKKMYFLAGEDHGVCKALGYSKALSKKYVRTKYQNVSYVKVDKLGSAIEWDPTAYDRSIYSTINCM